MALALLVLGRAAHLALRGLQGRRDARLLVLVLHDGPVEHIVPLEACMRSRGSVTTSRPAAPFGLEGVQRDHLLLITS